MVTHDFNDFSQSAPKYLTSKEEPTAQDLVEFHDWIMGLSNQQMGWLDAVVG